MARQFKPGPIRKVLNTLVTSMLRRGIATPGLYLLTTTGNKTGREITHPVQILGKSGRRWLVAPYGVVAWVRNARASGRVVLTRGSRSVTYSAHEVTPAEAAPILKRYVKIIPVVLPYFDVSWNASVEEFETEAIRHPVFELEPHR